MSNTFDFFSNASMKINFYWWAVPFQPSTMVPQKEKGIAVAGERSQVEKTAREPAGRGEMERGRLPLTILPLRVGWLEGWVSHEVIKNVFFFLPGKFASSLSQQILSSLFSLHIVQRWRHTLPPWGKPCSWEQRKERETSEFSVANVDEFYFNNWSCITFSGSYMTKH